MADDERKAALIAALDAQRARLAESAAQLRKMVATVKKARSNLLKNRVAWIVAAAALGVVASRLLPKRSRGGGDRSEPLKTAGRAGLAIAACKIAFDLARPALTAWATSRVSDYFMNGRGSSRGDRR